jgi:hypothetical protein
MSGAAVSSGTAAKGHSICAAQTGFRLVMVGAPAGFEPALTAPEAASAIERICTICLHGFNRSPPDGQDHSAYIPDHGGAVMKRLLLWVAAAVMPLGACMLIAGVPDPGVWIVVIAVGTALVVIAQAKPNIKGRR